jgi:MtrB/PioB family decaheme-associated outer membrane protein
MNSKFREEQRMQGVVTMNVRKLLACTLMGAAGLFPGWAASEEDAFTLEGVQRREAPLSSRLQLEYDSEVELRLGYVSDDSFKFGQYNGYEDDGVYVIGSANMSWGEDWTSGSTNYLDVEMHDIGMDTAEAYLEYGQQGVFSVFVNYDKTPLRVSDRGLTPYLGAGGTTLSLPSVWQPSNSTAGMTDLTSSLVPVDIDYEREKIEGGASFVLTDDLQLNMSYARETKEGRRTIGAVIGTNGGNPRAVVLPEPIDYTTSQFEVLLNYTGDRAQAQFRYHNSDFENDEESLTWDNAYCDDDTLLPGCTGNINGWALAASYPTGQGRLATPSENEFDQVTLSGAYEITDSTRANLTLSRGWMKQDDPYFPTTVNPGLATPIPLPVNSLDGEIVVSLLNFGISSRPASKLDVRANLRIDDRDNKTDRHDYFIVHGDAADQDTEARINLPYSYTETEARIDAGYRVLSSTRVELGYEYEYIDRDYQEVDDTTEHKLRFGVNSTPADMMNVRLDYEYGNRDAGSYDGLAPAIASHEPGVIDPLDPLAFENHPLLRKSHLADRKRNRLTSTISLTPSEVLSVDFNLNYLHDDYPNSPLGMQTSTAQAYSTDVTFMPSDALSGHVFYTYEILTSHLDGWAFSGGGNKGPHSSDPDRQWWLDSEDTVHTVGVGVELPMMNEELTLSLDYMYSTSTGDIEQTAGPAITAAPLPDLETDWHNVVVDLEYFVRTDLSLGFSYQYSSYESDDWAVDNVSANTLSNVIGLSQVESPEYDVHTFWVSMKYRF